MKAEPLGRGTAKYLGNAYGFSLFETFMFISPDSFFCILQHTILVWLPLRKSRDFFFYFSKGNQISEVHISSKRTIQGKN